MFVGPGAGYGREVTVDTAARRLTARVTTAVTCPGRRGLARDVAVLLAAAMVVIGASKGAAHDQIPPARPLDALAFALLTLIALTVTLRRRSPLAMLAASSVLVGCLLGAGYPHGPSFLPVAVAAVSVGLRYERRVVWRAVAGAAAVLLAGSVLGAARGYASGGWQAAFLTVGMVLLCAVPALVGVLARSGRAAAARAKEEATRRGVEQERLRMAREVHDVVGHSLSVISLRAAVALHVLDRRPEQAQLALEAIRRVSVDALDELRATLALTRSDQPDARALNATAEAAAEGRSPVGVEPPLTGLGRLPSLLREVRMCGLPVQLVTDGDPGRLTRLPVEVDLAAFRIVQESLTNVLRHAPRTGTQVQVRLAVPADRLTLDITDGPELSVAATPPAPDPVMGVPRGHDLAEDRGPASGQRSADDQGYADDPGPAGGQGLTGLRERSAELGGTLSAGPVAGGGWRVHAELPVPVGAGA
jgi:signal transduction histidine kinase